MLRMEADRLRESEIDSEMPTDLRVGQANQNGFELAKVFDDLRYGRHPDL